MFSTVIPRGEAQGGLVGYWNFDEGFGTTAGDSSGHDNTGTLYNGPVWVDGKVGKALSFDGADDYVQTPQSNSLDVTGQVTVEAWIFPRAYVDDTGCDSHIISRCDYSGGHLYVLGTFSNGKVSFSVNPYPDAHPSAVTLPLNAWAHLAMTYDGSYVRLYINGEFDSSYSQSGPIYTTSNWLAIGCKPTGPWGGAGTYAYFNGMIDEVRIYNRALSQQEIQTDMCTMLPSYNLQLYPSGGIVTYKNWPYSVGVRVTDQTGKGVPNQPIDVYDPIVSVWSHGTTNADGYFLYYWHKATNYGQFELEFKTGSLFKKYKVIVRLGDGITDKLQEMWRYYVTNYLGKDELGNVLLGGEGAAVYRTVDLVYLLPHTDVRACTEGQGYTLLRAYWMNDKDTFNRVRDWTYTNMWETTSQNQKRLAWFCKWNADTQKWQKGEGDDTPTAPDGDEDIALALVLAWYRWNDPKDCEMAKEILESILESDTVTLSDPQLGTVKYLTWGSSELTKQEGFALNPSYMAPYAYRVFASFDSEHNKNWSGLLYTSYKVLGECSYSSKDQNGKWLGLVPNCCYLTKVGLNSWQAIPSTDLNPLNTQNGLYGYDAFRTMWRLAVDVQWNNEEKARELLQGPAEFFYDEIQNPLIGIICSVYMLNGVRFSPIADAATYGGNIGAALYWGSSDRAKLTEKVYDLLDDYKYDISPLLGLYRHNWVWLGIALYAGIVEKVPSELKITLGSSADLFVKDSLDRGIGINSTNGQLVNEIPGATFSIDSEQVISISNPFFGPYEIQLIGTADGSYTLNLTLSTDSSTTSAQTFSGTITNGSIQTFTAELTASSFSLYSWDYVLKDTKRDTILRINTKDKYFQFIAPDKDFGVKYDAKMVQLKHVIIICYEDSGMRLIATAVDDRIDFCSAIAWDKTSNKKYLLIDKPNCRTS